MPKEIILLFDTNTGEGKVEAKGFQGSTCQDATQFLKNTLGKCSDFQRKSEWYEESIRLNNGNINSNLCG